MKEKEKEVKQMDDNVTQMTPKKVVAYTCGCCGNDFESHRVRNGEKLCKDCIELRRALKSFLKSGLSSEELIAKAEKLLAAS